VADGDGVAEGLGEGVTMVAEADAPGAVARGAEAAGADPQATRIRIAEIVSG